MRDAYLMEVPQNAAGLVSGGILFQIRLKAESDFPPEKFDHPLYQECQGCVHPAHNAKLLKETQEQIPE